MISSINNTNIDINKQILNSKSRPHTSGSNPHTPSQSSVSKLIFKYKYSSRNHQRDNQHPHNHSRSRSSSLSSFLPHSRSTSSSLPHSLPLGRKITNNIDLTRIGIQQTIIAEILDTAPNHQSSKTTTKYMRDNNIANKIDAVKF